MSTDLRPSDRRTFNYIHSDAESWRKKADVLAEVAYRLEIYRDPKDSSFIAFRFEDVYNMLIGFALENYYKGAIVARQFKNSEHIKANILDSKIKKHQLAELALDAGVVVKDSLYKSYLDYITESIVWRGRYPLPVNASGIDGSMTYHPPKEEDKFTVITSVGLAIPIDAVHELIEQAKSNLDKYAIKKDKK